jgi:hypothetical protein
MNGKTRPAASHLKTYSPSQIVIRALEGPVTVASKKSGRKWHCTALQFDLVGIGKSRGEALEELKGVVNAYLCELLKAKGKVRVFNPSDAAEWECEDKREFTVSVAIVGSKNPAEVPERLSFSKARRYSDRIQAVNMLPAAVGY